MSLSVPCWREQGTMTKPTGACAAGVKVRITRQRMVGKIARHSGADIAAGVTPGRPWHSTLRPWNRVTISRCGRELPVRLLVRALGYNPPLTCIVCRTFRGRLCPVTGHLIVKDERSFVGHCSHSSIGVGRAATGLFPDIQSRQSRMAGLTASECVLVLRTVRSLHLPRTCN